MGYAWSIHSSNLHFKSQEKMNDKTVAVDCTTLILNLLYLVLLMEHEDIKKACKMQALSLREIITDALISTNVL